MNPAAVFFLAASLSNPIDRAVHPERWQTTSIPPIAMPGTLDSRRAEKRLDDLRIDLLRMNIKATATEIELTKVEEKRFRELCKGDPKNAARWQELENQERERREQLGAYLKQNRDRLKELEEKQQSRP